MADETIQCPQYRCTGTFTDRGDGSGPFEFEDVVWKFRCVDPEKAEHPLNCEFMMSVANLRLLSRPILFGDGERDEAAHRAIEDGEPYYYFTTGKLELMNFPEPPDRISQDN